MKPTEKILNLLAEGFSLETLGRFTEKQLDAIHSRIVEQYTDVTTTKRVYSPAGRNKPQPLPSGAKTISVGTDGTVTAMESKDTEMVEKKKKSKKNPWAICTSTLSDEFGTSQRSEWTKSQMKKYERCVMDVKKTMKEGKDPYQKIIENKITEIVYRNLPGQMTKKQLIDMLLESPEIAPAKPKTKPDVKPGKPSTPFSPKPGPSTKPKAKMPTWFSFKNLGIKLKK